MVVFVFALGTVLLLAEIGLSSSAIRAWGPRRYEDGSFTAHGGAESLLFQTALDQGEVGVANYFWIQAGTSPYERYVTDTLVIRYYVDGEANASLVFTPAMAAASSVGRAGASYYAANATAPVAAATNTQHASSGRARRP